MNHTVHVVTYEQLKPALLGYLEAHPAAGERYRQHAANIRRLIDEIGDTSIHSVRWIAGAGELRYAVNEYLLEENRA